MKRISRDPETSEIASFDASDTGRLTWLGLTLAAIGWGLLIGESTVADIVVHKTQRPITPTFHADLMNIGECIIASGFAVAIIGALQRGFGALNRFFEAVLMRSSQRSVTVETTGPIEPEITPSSTKRPYRILSDGSVEVETIVGTRRFTNLTEARDFI